jgi:malate synthase
MNQDGYQINGELSRSNRFILCEEAMRFLTQIERATRDTRQALLKERQARQQQFDEGVFPDFLTKTRELRQGNWRVNNTPKDLQDRRVEITGPVDRKMLINALNSGAKVFMADFEDSNAPTWANCVNGQVNVHDAVRKTITYTDPITRKHYTLNKTTAVLMVRPRGWHLNEANVLIDAQPMSASLFDALLYLFHNANALLEQGTGPYFYLPKLESHLEARLWNEVFIQAERYLNLPNRSIKATVLIETITAAFEMDELIHELADYIVGLNCGRWDYIFSFIKKMRNHPQFLVPNRDQVSMTSPFLKAYVTLLVQTCHKRGIHALGGMAAQIPIKEDEQANQEAMARVYDDKKREVLAGHDGTWVAHPGLIPIALKAFNEFMQEDNQLNNIPQGPQISAKDLLAVPTGTITQEGVQNNISVALRYLESWLMGNGCVPIHNLMEDAATAEICRAQLWQWVRFSAPLAQSGTLTGALVRECLNDEFAHLFQERKKQARTTQYLSHAKALLEKMVFNPQFDEFLTVTAYPYLINERALV